MGESERLRGCLHALGGSSLRQLELQLLALGGEPGLFLPERADLVAGLGGRSGLSNQHKGCADQRCSGDEGLG